MRNIKKLPILKKHVASSIVYCFQLRFFQLEASIENNPEKYLKKKNLKILKKNIKKISKLIKNIEEI